jgi:hypothetical protein
MVNCSSLNWQMGGILADNNSIWPNVFSWPLTNGSNLSWQLSDYRVPGDFSDLSLHSSRIFCSYICLLQVENSALQNKVMAIYGKSERLFLFMCLSRDKCQNVDIPYRKLNYRKLLIYCWQSQTLYLSNQRKNSQNHNPYWQKISNSNDKQSAELYLYLNFIFHWNDTHIS